MPTLNDTHARPAALGLVGAARGGLSVLEGTTCSARQPYREVELIWGKRACTEGQQEHCSACTAAVQGARRALPAHVDLLKRRSSSLGACAEAPVEDPVPSSQRIPCGAAGLTPSVCFGEPRTSSAPASKCASLAGPPVQFLPLDSPVCNTPAAPVDCGVKASMRNPRQRQARGGPSERRRQPLPGDVHRTAVASAAPPKLDRRWRTYSKEEEAPTPPLKACVTRCLARRGFPLGVVSENTKTVAAMLSVLPKPCTNERQGGI